MLTKIISLQEYRANLAKFSKQGREHQVKYVVLVRSKPAFEVIPIGDDYGIYEEDSAVELHELAEDEIPSALREKIEAAKQKPILSFRNV